MDNELKCSNDEIQTRIELAKSELSFAMESVIESEDKLTEVREALDSDTKKFNRNLDLLATATEAFEAGRMTGPEVKEKMLNPIKEIKEIAVHYGIADESVGADDISEDEIAGVHQILVNAKEVLESVQENLNNVPEVAESTEGLEVDDFDVPATESAIDTKAAAYRRMPQVKTADELVKSAKKLYMIGSKEKAISYMNKAKKVYEEALKKVYSDRNFYEAKMTYGAASGSPAVGYMQGSTTTRTRKVTDHYSMSAAVAFFENRIDTCEAYLLQWQNKAGNKQFKDTKAMLKAERIKEKQLARARKKGATEAMFEENLDALDALESYMAFEFDIDEGLDASMESMDSEDLDAEIAALEASLEEDSEGDDAFAALEAAVADLGFEDDGEAAMESIEAEVDKLIESL